MNAKQAAFVSQIDKWEEELKNHASLESGAVHDIIQQLHSSAFLPELYESWKYTSLHKLDGFFQKTHSSSIQEKWVTEQLERYNSLTFLQEATQLVVLNGKVGEPIRPSHRDILVFIEEPCSQKEALAWWQTESPSKVHTLYLLNILLARQVIHIRIPKGAAHQKLFLADLQDARKENVVSHTHYAITLEEGSSLEMVEVASGEGSYGHHPFLTIKVEKGASFHHVRLFDHSSSARGFGGVYAYVAEHGVYDSFLCLKGGEFHRNEVRVILAGEHAKAHVNGVQVLRNTQQADITSYIAHMAPHTASRQTIKNVISGKAKGIFQGKIYVDRAAQKTDGYQMNQALLLSDIAEIDAKPELEIYADDVKCSHGATVGALNAEQLFFLRSRGIPLEEARNLLVSAFVTEAFDLIENEELRAFLDHFSLSTGLE
ncbi:Fe-S cluster assembly protein SufD [Entomobacter blattae]|uniref:FeS cluster assembly protein SufD n=1 Tax=Entomobacter blattae TaxID=2762277 RepID=A0A7H1NSV4_9PROT|nr:Fe-S cluster assembly protein SufD [Entomobacter blattae]QNT78864.1 FeS cluster assembly protein SufD [Entomobacter blattae]